MVVIVVPVVLVTLAIAIAAVIIYCCLCGRWSTRRRNERFNNPRVVDVVEASKKSSPPTHVVIAGANGRIATVASTAAIMTGRQEPAWAIDVDDDLDGFNNWQASTLPPRQLVLGSSPDLARHVDFDTVEDPIAYWHQQHQRGYSDTGLYQNEAEKKPDKRYSSDIYLDTTSIELDLNASHELGLRMTEAQSPSQLVERTESSPDDNNSSL